MSAPKPGPVAWLDGLDAARSAADGLPWHVDPQDDHRIADLDGGGVTSTFLPDDAALIVAAVNALPELVARLRAVAALADWCAEMADRNESRAEQHHDAGDHEAENYRVGRAVSYQQIADRIRAAIEEPKP